jgi:hypothetical protein
MARASDHARHTTRAIALRPITESQNRTDGILGRRYLAGEPAPPVDLRK